MRVLLLLANPTRTGPGDQVLHLARGLIQAGHAVWLGCDQKRPGNMAALARDMGIPLTPGLEISVKSSPAGMAADVLGLRRFIRREQPDLIHCHLSHDHALALLAGMDRPPIIRSFHTAGAFRHGMALDWALKRTRMAIVACEVHRRELIDLHPAAREITRVLPGVVDTRRFQPGGRDESLRARLKLPGGKFMIGCVARFQAGRRQEILLAALRMLLDRGRPVHLALVGKGETLPAIQQEISRLRLEPHVTLTGFLDEDLPGLYRLLDLAVVLALGHDATARMVLEAWASGIPVAAGGDPALEALISPDVGVNLGAKPPSAEALAEAIDGVISGASCFQPAAPRARAEASAPGPWLGRVLEIYHAALPR